MYSVCIMTASRPKRIFLDYASITPVDPNVLEKMNASLAESFANPSALYTEALTARETMNMARRDCARVLGGQDSEIIFTSGGTESNNLALLGVFEHAIQTGIKKPHIITTTIEHPAVLEVCKEIERRGGEVTYVAVNEDGVVSPKDIQKAMTDSTVLVSVMYANNEIGSIQPIKEIVKGIREWRQQHDTALPYVHTDACQAILYEPIHVIKLGVDLLTLDGIKMYGPRGMGLLYVRTGVVLHPLTFGGGQQGGIRSGTEHVAGMVGLAYALDIAESYREIESERLIKIRDYGINKILETFPQATINGSRENRLPNNINICFPGIDAEFVVISLDVVGISASYSSACRTLKEDSSSYVIEALGKKDCANSSLRFTLGRETVQGDMDSLVETLKEMLL